METENQKIRETENIVQKIENEDQKRTREPKTSKLPKDYKPAGKTENQRIENRETGYRNQ